MARKYNTSQRHTLFPPQHGHVVSVRAGRCTEKLTEAGYWYATAPEEELRELLRQDPAVLRDWDDKYGDRMIKLVFIGQNLDRNALEKELDSCLAR